MPAIAAVAGDLIAAPKPAISLDTCDILEVVQCFDWERWEGKERNSPRPVTCIEAVRRLLNTLTLDPNRAGRHHGPRSPGVEPEH